MAKAKKVKTIDSENSLVKSRGRPKGSNAREVIVNNAGAAFVKHGYHACTVEYILEETEVSRTNFYRFFKNKEEVFASVFQHCLGNLQLEMDNHRKVLEKNLSVEEKVSHVLEGYLRACFSIEDLLPIIIQESQTLPEYRELREKTIKHFTSTMSRNLVAGGYKKPDALYLEGMTAAIDRMMLIESKKSGKVEEKIKRLKLVCLKFINLMLEENKPN